MFRCVLEAERVKAKTLSLIKIVAAGCLAFAILNLFSLFYRGGQPRIADETMAAPVRYVPDSFYSVMTEGISIGHYDRNGFNNAYPGGDSIDYLCLGSSHMEAKQVMPDQNTIYVLNELLNSGGGIGRAYNIGVAGNLLPACVNRLHCAVETYHPQKAVLLETSLLDFSTQEITEALGEPTVGQLQYAFNGGIMGLVRKLPFIRLVYLQYQDLRMNRADEAAAGAESVQPAAFDSAAYTGKMTPLIEKAVQDADGLPVVIFYHPKLLVDRDGSATTDGDPDMIRQFRTICEGQGVYFLDMSGRFLREYEENHILPNGFANGSVGKGHLNRYGHAMIAQELYRLLQEVT